MRVLGNSTSDPSKFIVEVSAKELAVFKSLCKPQSPQTFSSQHGNSQAEGMIRRKIDEGWVEMDEDNEESCNLTTDQILDDYNAKKISKDDMNGLMNDITRRQ